MMKTNAKRKNSAAKKLIPAAGMLALSASMLATSTYAWFTMNKVVEVTGMELKTKVGSNLLICSDNLEEHYATGTLSEGRKALLEPVSSINGTTGSFFYTTNATAKGTSLAGATFTQYNENGNIQNTVAGKNMYDATFNSTYGQPTITSENISMNETEGSERDGAAYGYIDYVFYLKATGDQAANTLNMTECNLLYGGQTIDSTNKTVGVDLDRAWRVAVFSQELATGGGTGNTGSALNISQTDPASTASNLKGILGLSGATYFSQEGENNASTIQARTTNGALGNVASGKFMNGSDETGVVLDTFNTAGTTKYYKVLVRLWLEGEDNTCNSATYAKLESGKWALNCKFELNQGTTVKGLNTNANNVAANTQILTTVASPIEVNTIANS